MEERITVRLSKPDKDKFVALTRMVDMTVSEAIRKMVIFINNLEEVEAQVFLHDVRIYNPNPGPSTLTMRG